MSVMDELLALKNDDGLIIVETVHDWAQSNKDSDLYAQLEWNNNKAGYEYRLWQIRRLVALNIVSEEGERQVVSLSVDRVQPAGGYRDLNDVLKTKSLYSILLRDAFAELDRVR